MQSFQFEIAIHLHSALTFSNEEVHYGQCHRVSAEHVIAARSYALYRHAKPTPNGVRSRYAQHNGLTNS